MSFRRVVAAEVAAQPWRNGGGCTRELLAWPAPQHWRLRVSLADIDADGPFSAFPGVERWLAVVAGAGVALAFDDGERRLVSGDAPLRFDGARPPGCRLLDGSTVDLNLMVQDGSAAMRPVEAGVAWPPAFAIRALFANVAGLLSGDGESLPMAPRTLAWADAAAEGRTAWTFAAEAPSPAVAGWWLGYTPRGARP
jgi:hypothetical protein